ncbi:MAG TPA: efflux RND transporter periplasmic adaptor subunit [Gemmatimonadales bacterium]|jgi:multidrug efflux pump subunit AcrA (membrane-fusion protein)|nr:efflux RND transporter periplasmic adaptor subunit [Gemmatimonadales bacterium]
MTPSEIDPPVRPSNGAPEPAPQPHNHVLHDDVGAAPPVTPVSTNRMVMIGAAIVVVLAGLFVMSFLPRRAVSRELAHDAAASATMPIAQVVTVRRAAVGGTIDLPGTIESLHESAVYARVSGYVKRWNVDIGGLVRAGDVLADIDVPELAQEVEQARHQVAQTTAALGLAKADLARWKEMAADSAVSREELDQKQAAFDAAVANGGASEANLQRLLAMQNFTQVTAPFAGVVTARNIDIGSLITPAGATSAPAGGAGGAGAQSPGALFRIAETDTVRMYIPVPESDATSMTTGLQAQVTVQELSGRTFTGHVVRTSHELDPASRTLLAEVDIANPRFVLLPGMYANVRLQFPMASPRLVIPSAALVVRSLGTQVMVVDSVGPDTTATVHLRTVQVGRDNGAEIEILNGVPEGAMVVTNPDADMQDGMRVRVMQPAPAGTGSSQ